MWVLAQQMSGYPTYQELGNPSAAYKRFAVWLQVRRLAYFVAWLGPALRQNRRIVGYAFCLQTTTPP